jgi:hypothetical protein
VGKQLPVIARNPFDEDDMEPVIVFYNHDCSLDYIARGLYEHDGLEFQFVSTIEQFHGAAFANQYGLALTNDSYVYERTLADIASDWIIHYAEENYAYE